MKVLKNSQIRLETLNHALITSPEGKEWRISHWAVDIENLHEILVVCHEAEGLRMDENTVPRRIWPSGFARLSQVGERIASSQTEMESLPSRS